MGTIGCEWAVTSLGRPQHGANNTGRSAYGWVLREGSRALECGPAQYSSDVSSGYSSGALGRTCYAIVGRSARKMLAAYRANVACCLLSVTVRSAAHVPA